jgi:hypothetical protein
MKPRFFEILAIAAVSFCAGSLVAHHSTSAGFDLEDLTWRKGVITDVRWANPHTFMFMDVTTCKVDNWAVELGSRVAMDRAGLSRNNLKPGIAISVLSAPAKSVSSAPSSQQDVVERAQLKHFVLGGCLTLPSGERVEYGEGPSCPKPPRTIPEEGVFTR